MLPPTKAAFSFLDGNPELELAGLHCLTFRHL